MKSKLIWIVIVVTIGAFSVNKFLEQKAVRDAEREAKKAEILRGKQEVIAAVLQLSERHNAIADWEKQLSKGESYRISPILTFELQNLWKGERPILFIGSIKDISSTDANTYHVVVEKSIYNLAYMFITELRLSLSAKKTTIDSFLKKYPELLGSDGYSNGIAVVAKIHSISSSYELNEDGERIEVKTGQGQLIELAYTGDVIFERSIAEQ